MRKPKPKFKKGDHVRLWETYSCLPHVRTLIGSCGYVVDIHIGQCRPIYLVEVNNLNHWFMEQDLKLSAIELDIIWR